MPIQIPDGFAIRLPTEIEWERAARGTDGREYPWGAEESRQYANYAKEIGVVEGTSAVFTYPQGISPTGVWDLSGNVFEWTSSWYEKPDEFRVVRGGSWAFYHGFAR